MLSSALLIGVGATLLMDLWNVLLKRGFGIRSLDYCLLGRWVSHMAAGTFRHASITAAAARPGECLLGWVSHYSIGIGFALGFLLLVGREWLDRPTPLPAVAFGLVTVAVPLFVMQPAIGLGIASSKTPHPARARLKSLGTHLVFGVGLYALALVWRFAG
ncbi:MAG: DUF2938 domain-containing protein [Gemmatimonadales bacterium]